MEHISHLPGCLCCISFDCVSQGIHSGRCCQSFWHRRHHFRVNHCDYRHIMWIYTYKFSLFLYVCNNVIDRYFCCCTGCCWNCNNRNARVLCRCNTFQTSYIFKFRICNNDTNCLGCIHGWSSTDCNNIICFCIFKCLNAMLHILDGRVCFNIRINFISKSWIIKDICHFSCHSKFNQIWIRTYKCFFECSCLCFICDFLNRTCSMIRCLI